VKKVKMFMTEKQEVIFPFYYFQKQLTLQQYSGYFFVALEKKVSLVF